MSYISNSPVTLNNDGLGCGPGCDCGPCKSGVSGVDEWYVRDDRSATAKDLSGYGFGEPAAPMCEPATSSVEALSTYIDLLNGELGKGSAKSATRLAAKRRLVLLEAEVIIRSLDAFIAAGCCEPNLRGLESKVRGLPWPSEAAPIRIKLLSAIIAAGDRAKKNHELC